MSYYYINKGSPHDSEDLLGEGAILLVPGLLAGLAGHVHLALQVGNLVLLEGLGELGHLASQIWKEEGWSIIVIHLQQHL